MVFQNYGIEPSGRIKSPNSSLASAATESVVGKLAVDARGAVLAEELAMLRQRESEAAASRNYAAATLLRDLHGVVGPKPALTLEDCTPDTLEQQFAFFLENGFCVIPRVLEGEALERARAAWLRREAVARRKYEEERALAPPLTAEERLEAERRNPQSLFNSDGRPVTRADGSAVGHGAYRTFFDTDHLAEEDDVFVELIDSPKAVPLLSMVVGNGGLQKGETYDRNYGTVRLRGISGRVVPPEGNSDGYCVWHQDVPPPDRWPRPKQRYVKTFTNLWAVPFNGGESGLVPGSHRLPEGPEQTLHVRFRSGRNVGYNVYDEKCLPQSAMPNHVRFPVDAGTMVIFDNAIWHTSMPNLGACAGGLDGRSRCTVEIDYQSSETPHSGPHISEQTLQRLAESGRLPVPRRRLLGLPDEGMGPF